MNPIALFAVGGATGIDIPLWLTAPFALLLLLIAVMPLTPPRVKHLWDRYYMHTALGLGLVVVAYYLCHAGEETVLATSKEYFSFISLIGSLFVVAGGIHLKVKGEATPWANVVFLAIGAVAANLIGTTGASMVLIRPFIRMNKVRISAYHIVFFIFIVSNCGGALTPIGDPPLFIGYLRGVPFFWLMGHVIARQNRGARHLALRGRRQRATVAGDHRRGFSPGEILPARTGDARGSGGLLPAHAAGRA
jgi:Na+/H+ antiporter NhaD/arsenite permease-like protein